MNREYENEYADMNMNAMFRWDFNARAPVSSLRFRFFGQADVAAGVDFAAIVAGSDASVDYDN